LYEVDTALIARRHVAGQVADDAAAERDEAAVAMEAAVDEAVDDGRESRQRFMALAVGQHHGGDLAPFQCALHALQVQRRHDFIRDDQHLLGCDAIELAVGKQLRPDMNGVTA
jgi:hypothetical protein